MTAPAQRETTGHRIRLARAEDAAALAALAERTFRDTFAADNDPLDMDAYVAQAYGAAVQARELADPRVVTLVAGEAPDLAAFAQLRRGPARRRLRGPIRSSSGASTSTGRTTAAGLPMR